MSILRMKKSAALCIVRLLPIVISHSSANNGGDRDSPSIVPLKGPKRRTLKKGKNKKKGKNGEGRQRNDQRESNDFTNFQEQDFIDYSEQALTQFLIEGLDKSVQEPIPSNDFNIDWATLFATKDPTSFPSKRPTGEPSKSLTNRPTEQPTSPTSSSPKSKSPTELPSDKQQLSPTTLTPTTCDDRKWHYHVLSGCTNSYSVESLHSKNVFTTRIACCAKKFGGIEGCVIHDSCKSTAVSTQSPSSDPTTSPSRGPTSMLSADNPEMQSEAPATRKPTLSLNSFRTTKSPAYASLNTPGVMHSPSPSMMKFGKSPAQSLGQHLMLSLVGKQPSFSPNTSPIIGKPSNVPTNKSSVTYSTVPSTLISGNPPMQSSEQLSVMSSEMPLLHPTENRPTISLSSSPATASSSRAPPNHSSAIHSTVNFAMTSEQPSSQSSEQRSSTSSKMLSELSATKHLTMSPSSTPTTSSPTYALSNILTVIYSTMPSAMKSDQPSVQSSEQPSVINSEMSSGQPRTKYPILLPRLLPKTYAPSNHPSLMHSMVPSLRKSEQQSVQSSGLSVMSLEMLSEQPTAKQTPFYPSASPTPGKPAHALSSKPSMMHPAVPSVLMSGKLSVKRSGQPSVMSSEIPLAQPTTKHPTLSPTKSPGTASLTFATSNQSSPIHSTVSSPKKSKQPIAQSSEQPSSTSLKMPSDQPAVKYPTLFPGSSQITSSPPYALPNNLVVTHSIVPSVMKSDKPSVRSSEQSSEQQPVIYLEMPSGQSTTKQPPLSTSSLPITESRLYAPSNHPNLMHFMVPSLMKSGSSAQSLGQSSTVISDMPSEQPTTKRTTFYPSTSRTAAEPIYFLSNKPSVMHSIAPSVTRSEQPTMISSRISPAQSIKEQETLSPRSSLAPASRRYAPSNQLIAMHSTMPSTIKSEQLSEQNSTHPSSPSSLSWKMQSEQPVTKHLTFSPSSSPTTSNPTYALLTNQSVIHSMVPSVIKSDQPSARSSGQPLLINLELPFGQPSIKEPTVPPSSLPKSENQIYASSLVPSMAKHGQIFALSEQPSARELDMSPGQPTAKKQAIPPSSLPTTEIQTYASLNQLSFMYSMVPSVVKSEQPSVQSLGEPSVVSSEIPSQQPMTKQTNFHPGASATTGKPKNTLSIRPSMMLSTVPSVQSSEQPSVTSSEIPLAPPTTKQPTLSVSSSPTAASPKYVSSNQPSVMYSAVLSPRKSEGPSAQNLEQPSHISSKIPSEDPETKHLTMTPNSMPITSNATHFLATKPIVVDSVVPSMMKFDEPSVQSSEQPSAIDLEMPSGQPTTKKRSLPQSSLPSKSQTRAPSNHPYLMHSMVPSMMKSSQPSAQSSWQFPAVSSEIPPEHQEIKKTPFYPIISPTPAKSTNILSNKPSMMRSTVLLMSGQPSMYNFEQPSVISAVIPSKQPTTKQPTLSSSSLPATASPSRTPSNQPNAIQSMVPSMMKLEQPSLQGTEQQPTLISPKIQSEQPSTKHPTLSPSSPPITLNPTHALSINPSVMPSIVPSVIKSGQPSVRSSEHPLATNTEMPSGQSTTKKWSFQPSLLPSIKSKRYARPNQPSLTHSMASSVIKSGQPSAQNSMQPSAVSSEMPSEQSTMKETTYGPFALPIAAKPKNALSMKPSMMHPAVTSVLISGKPSVLSSEQPLMTSSELPLTQPTSKQPTLSQNSSPATTNKKHPSSNQLSLIFSPSSLPIKSNLTHALSENPSVIHSTMPSIMKPVQSSVHSSQQPLVINSEMPSLQPRTKQPTVLPSLLPPAESLMFASSKQPSFMHYLVPSVMKSWQPSANNSAWPSSVILERQTEQPAKQQTAFYPGAPPATAKPTHALLNKPSFVHSALPSVMVSVQPSVHSSGKRPMSKPETPTVQITQKHPSSSPANTSPTYAPPNHPSAMHSTVHSIMKAEQPSGQSSHHPLSISLKMPSDKPATKDPTLSPSSLAIISSPLYYALLNNSNGMHSMSPSVMKSDRPPTRSSKQLSGINLEIPSGKPTRKQLALPLSSLPTTKSPACVTANQPSSVHSMVPFVVTSRQSMQSSGQPFLEMLSRQPLTKHPTSSPSALRTIAKPTHALPNMPSVVHFTGQMTEGPTSSPSSSWIVSNPAYALSNNKGVIHSIVPYVNESDSPYALPNHPSLTHSMLPSEMKFGQVSVQTSEQPPVTSSERPLKQPTSHQTALPSTSSSITSSPAYAVPFMIRSEKPSVQSLKQPSVKSSEMPMDQQKKKKTILSSSPSPPITSEKELPSDGLNNFSTEFAPVTLGGTVYHDRNKNGMMDSSESKVSGVVAQAKSCDNDRIVALGLSSFDGSYQLNNIGPPGCYYIELFVESDQSSFEVSTTSRTENIILGIGEINLSYNIGIAVPPTSGALMTPSSASPSRESTSKNRLIILPRLTSNQPTSSPNGSQSTNEPTSLSDASQTSTSAVVSTSKPSILPQTNQTTGYPSVGPSTGSPTPQLPYSLTAKPVRGPSSRPMANLAKAPRKVPTASPSATDGIALTQMSNPTLMPFTAAQKVSDSLGLTVHYPVTLLAIQKPTPKSGTEALTKEPTTRSATDKPVHQHMQESALPHPTKESTPMVVIDILTPKPSLFPSLLHTEKTVPNPESDGPMEQPSTSITNSPTSRGSFPPFHFPTNMLSKKPVAVAPSSQPSAVSMTSMSISDHSKELTAKPTTAPTYDPMKYPTDESAIINPTKYPTIGPTKTLNNQSTNEPITARPTRSHTKPRMEPQLTFTPIINHSEPVTINLLRPPSDKSTLAPPKHTYNAHAPQPSINHTSSNLNSTKKSTHELLGQPQNEPTSQPSIESVSSSPYNMVKTDNPTLHPIKKTAITAVLDSPTKRLFGKSDTDCTTMPPKNEVTTNPTGKPARKPMAESKAPSREFSSFRLPTQPGFRPTSNPSLDLSGKPSILTNSTNMAHVPTAMLIASPTLSPRLSRLTPSKLNMNESISKPSPSPMLVKRATKHPMSTASSIKEPHDYPTLTPSLSWIRQPPPIPTLITTGQQSQSPVTFSVSQLPILRLTLFETQGQLSEDAVEDLSLVVNGFYSTKLTEHYIGNGNYYFQAVGLVPVKQNAIIQQTKGGEPIRNLRQGFRRMEGVTGTKIIFYGMMEFHGDVPPSNEIVNLITFVSEGHNDDLVSSIVGTGNSELSNIYEVVVEEDHFIYVPLSQVETQITSASQAPFALQSPSSFPSAFSDNFLHTPNGIKGPGGSEDDNGRPNMTTMIITIASVATLTMLIFVFVAHMRHSHRDNMQTRNMEMDHAVTTPASSNNNIFHDLSSNTGELLTIDWDNHSVNATHSMCEEESNLAEQYEVEGAKLKSAAELNSQGTMTMEKEHKSAMPKAWLNALHGDGVSIISPQYEVAEGDGLETSSVADSSTEHSESSNYGGFPCGFPCYNDGAFPSKRSGGKSTLDLSHIGTVEVDDLPSGSKPSALGIVQTLSQETDVSKSSLNQFISDLVWLENKIAEMGAKEAVEVNIQELGQEGSRSGDNIQATDSFSYECDSFSPRSLSDEESTITSITNSQAMSIICRDCYIPPGNLDIEIASTKDGPLIKAINDRSLASHLNVGDLIMALDDRDTRSLSAELLAMTLSSRASFQRKLTLLHFGSSGTQ